MALLNFKMGNWSSEFSKIPVTPGTVYITKNEKGMYVDTNDNKRIRISGDIIQVESARVAQPPFSTDALYYFIEENALLKWNGTEWKQLNSVSDITANISTLQNDVASLKEKVGAAASKDNEGNDVAATGLFKSVEDLTKVDTSLQEQITANKQAIESNDTDISNLDTRLKAAEEITGKVADIESTVAEHEEKIGNHEDAIKTLQDTVGIGEGEDNLVTKVADLTGRLGTAESDIDNIQKKDTEQDGKIKDVEDLAAANKEKIDTLMADENTANSVANAVKVEADARSAADNTLQGLIGTLSGRVDGIDTANIERDKKIGDNENKIAEHEEKLTTLMGDKDTAGSVANSIEAAKEALSAEIDADINAANAMEYKGGITELSQLPSENVKIGDTYVVTAKFIENGTVYNPGDMLIAKGTEATEGDTTGYIGDDLAWNHVKTGYDAANEAKLSGEGNAINLTSHLNTETYGDLGKITFVSVKDHIEGENDEAGFKVTIADNQITLGMQWGEF